MRMRRWVRVATRMRMGHGRLEQSVGEGGVDLRRLPALPSSRWWWRLGGGGREGGVDQIEGYVCG